MHKVVISQRFFDEKTADYLRLNNCEPVLVDLPPGQADGEIPEDILVEWLGDASGWIVGHARVTRELLLRLPKLQVISRRGVGYDRVDVNAVKDLGKVAAIAVGSNDATVADATLGLMLAVARRFRECQSNMEQGSWSIPLGSDLYRKTVGVVGLGNIGKAVVKRLQGFDTRILVHSRTKDVALAETSGFEYADLDVIMKESDFLTLHAPLNAESRFLVRDETLKLMKKNAFVINTARGGLVEDRHLLQALIDVPPC